MQYKEVASDDVIKKVRAALKANGINSVVVANGEEAKQKALEIIPLGAGIMNNTSVTVDSIGLADEILKSGKYNPARTKLKDPNIPQLEKQALGAASEWTIGSVHAITHDGSVVIASNTGSQLPGYAYGSMHVLWIVGAQKIVSNLDEAMKRIYDYVKPLEADRAKKAYGPTSETNVSKILIVNKEVKPDRITIILIKESIGF